MHHTLPPGVPPRGHHKNNSMESAGSILSQLHADLIISKQKLDKINGIELVRLKREQANQSLCFSSRPFVLCGLPVRRLPNDQLLYERRNGNFILQITGHPNSACPSVRIASCPSSWPRSRSSRKVR